jgi:DNA repair protein SbcD/Mre11
MTRQGMKKKQHMKIIHTSDWHLGRALYGRKRHDEFDRFLDWMSGIVRDEQPDALLIAGDIFDSTTPSNRAQEQYYRFLCRTAASPCRHVVVIAGNHDSPSFLNAPRELLRALDIHVIGASSDDPADETVLLKDPDDEPELIVCAVPYLRDRDIRSSEPGESFDDRDRKMKEGISAHYARVIDHAKRLRRDAIETNTTVAAGRRAGSPEVHRLPVPIVVMGHLFTRGGKTVEGDGVRELYVGSLAHVPADIFPGSVDYVALGHLHVPQTVAGRKTVRYSGSPLPMGFNEAKQVKSLCVIEIDPPRQGSGSAETDHAGKTESGADSDGLSGRADVTVRLIDVPVFQSLERISGSLDEMEKQVAALKQAGSDAWLELEYTGQAVIGDLRDRLEEAVSGSKMDIVRIKNRTLSQAILKRVQDEETLDDLSPEDVFARCLDFHGVPDEQRNDLIVLFRDVVRSLAESDPAAE